MPLSHRCSKCQLITSKFVMADVLDIKIAREIVHHDLATLKRSATLGCELCVLLLQYIAYATPYFYGQIGTEMTAGPITLRSSARHVITRRGSTERASLLPTLYMSGASNTVVSDVDCSVSAAQNDSSRAMLDPNFVPMRIKREIFLYMEGLNW